MEGLKRTEKNRVQIREDVRFDVLRAYVINSGGKMPEQQCEDKRGFGFEAKLLWWLDPPLPDHENYIVIEEEKLDGQWTISTELRVAPVRVFT